MFFKKGLHRLSDEELMEMVHQGSEQSLTEIYQRYSTALMRYFTRMLWNDRQKAEDFLHDLFVKIINNPQRFDTSRKFSTWLYSVAHNMCKNEYRKNQFRSNATNHFSLDEKSDVDTRLDITAAHYALTKVLSELDEDDRALLLLRYEEDLGIQEISSIISLPEGTVKSRLFYLRKQLAEKLKIYRLTFN
jgi:RNA polymerase sigma-70 factor, ECF subfamily